MVVEEVQIGFHSLHRLGLDKSISDLPFFVYEVLIPFVVPLTLLQHKVFQTRDLILHLL